MNYGCRVILVLLVSAAVSRIAFPCSVSHVQSAAEVTRAADTIVLAEVLSYAKKNKYGGEVTFGVLEVLKGSVATKQLVLDGQTDAYDGANDQPPPYNFVRRGGRHGNCFANDYKLGGKFLLFLSKGSATWSPLAATNEEVSGPADPWVWWVKGYLSSISEPAPGAIGG